MSIFAPHIFIYVSTSSVAQWQSNRLLTDRSLVRIQPGEPKKALMRTFHREFAFFYLVTSNLSLLVAARKLSLKNNDTVSV